MKYISYINDLFKFNINGLNNFVAFGQNINAGSCLGGLCKDFKQGNRRAIINTPNTENSLVGLGFGLMLNGTSSAFFMKQQDFLLLGIDQLVNTHNFIKCQQLDSSFSIVNITMDAGFEGIQSSFNNLYDLCSISGCSGFTISSKQEADYIIDTLFYNPGFRIISVSQRLFHSEILDISGGTLISNEETVQYVLGKDLTIACFNFSLPQGKQLLDELTNSKINASLFSVFGAHNKNYNVIIENAIKTNKLLIISDSKSYFSNCDFLELQAIRAGVERVKVLKRSVSEDAYSRPNSENFTIDKMSVISNFNL